MRFLNQMREWGKLCKEIWIWNYPTLYTHGMNIYSLFPGVYRNTENLKLAHDANVRYIIAEQGGSVVHGCSFKELNVYLQCLMTEDVNVDVDAAIKAEKYDPATYGILDFTQNDKHGGFCFCPKCQALVEKYKTPGGPYFDFLVEMGEHFAKKYPKLMFRFFSYQEDMTGIPPKGIKFPDNMSVIIAPL